MYFHFSFKEKKASQVRECRSIQGRYHYLWNKHDQPIVQSTNRLLQYASKRVKYIHKKVIYFKHFPLKYWIVQNWFLFVLDVFFFSEIKILMFIEFICQTSDESHISGNLKPNRPNHDFNIENAFRIMQYELIFWEIN